MRGLSETAMGRFESRKDRVIHDSDRWADWYKWLKAAPNLSDEVRKGFIRCIEELAGTNSIGVGSK
jgi:hypothetical protein